jgi:hypothetical protein
MDGLDEVGSFHRSSGRADAGSGPERSVGLAPSGARSGVGIWTVKGRPEGLASRLHEVPGVTVTGGAYDAVRGEGARVRKREP